MIGRVTEVDFVRYNQEFDRKKASIERKIRKCLRCGVGFSSCSKGNRICYACNKKVRSEREFTLGIDGCYKKV